ncbi:NAD(P)/FAD-dependent oxidoreductase [Micromonospora sp. B006]|uniref:NAD(P)/FAD-dependent oxidoreductase n=1 Tax=Micromonospora sp. B006 TaxID=2201999 RepID=UPI000E302A44|nr:FAD-dependent oxidoreductase [Micromonospora sp. B006]AXO37855.1 amine oxidase [Micromonospora sp. B006]
MPDSPRRIAVIGAGIAGLTAAHLLQRVAEVTLYEADDRLGGHAHTHDVRTADGVLPVDSGFIVHNERTYPLLGRLLAELGVETQPAAMSMSVRCDGCGLAYAGSRGPVGLLPRGDRGRYLALLGQVPLFYRRARHLLAEPPVTGAPEPTLGEFLAAGRYSRYFVDHFVAPLVAAVWSCGPHLAADYPARHLFAFLDNHTMLQVRRSPGWRTVRGGSRTYVRAVAAKLSAVRPGAAVRAVRRHGRGVTVHDVTGDASDFEGVVVATHADQALRLLERPTRRERELLGAFAYARNEAVLHTDGSVLPDRPGVRAAWNYTQPNCRPANGGVRISYCMNTLQSLPTRTPVVVTLNGDGHIAPERVLARMTYEHPIYTRRAVEAQRGLAELNEGGVVFAGAYHGWGFHEDGCRSGAAAAARGGAVR